jgi:hypothetical protein
MFTHQTGSQIRLRWWINGAWCHAVHVLQNSVPSYKLRHVNKFPRPWPMHICWIIPSDIIIWTRSEKKKKSWTWGTSFLFPFLRTTKFSRKQIIKCSGQQTHKSTTSRMDWGFQILSRPAGFGFHCSRANKRC